MAIKKIRIKRAAPIRDPVTYRRSLLNDFHSASDEISKLIKSSVRRVRNDDASSDADQVGDDLDSNAILLLAAFIAGISAAYTGIKRFHDQQFVLYIFRATGFNIPSESGMMESNGTPFFYNRGESWATDLSNSWQSKFVDSVNKNLSILIDDVKSSIQDMGIKGYGWDKTDELIDSGMLKFIKRGDRDINTLVSNLFGALNRLRQQDAGISHYFWRGRLDDRERILHVLREKKRFSWDLPPEDGHPGDPWNCRCWAEPDLTTSIFYTGV